MSSAKGWTTMSSTWIVTVTCTVCQTEQTAEMVRKLKYHEKKLLKKVDFVSWKADTNIREIQILRKYHIQKRDDYTKLVEIHVYTPALFISLCVYFPVFFV